MKKSKISFVVLIALSLFGYGLLSLFTFNNVSSAVAETVASTTQGVDDSATKIYFVNPKIETSGDGTTAEKAFGEISVAISACKSDTENGVSCTSYTLVIMSTISIADSYGIIYENTSGKDIYLVRYSEFTSIGNYKSMVYFANTNQTGTVQRTFGFVGKENARFIFDGGYTINKNGEKTPYEYKQSSALCISTDSTNSTSKISLPYTKLQLDYVTIQNFTNTDDSNNGYGVVYTSTDSSFSNVILQNNKSTRNGENARIGFCSGEYYTREFTNCKFLGNTGNLVYIERGKNETFTNCTFENNTTRCDSLVSFVNCGSENTSADVLGMYGVRFTGNKAESCTDTSTTSKYLLIDAENISSNIEIKKCQYENADVLNAFENNDWSESSYFNGAIYFGINPDNRQVAIQDVNSISNNTEGSKDFDEESSFLYILGGDKKSTSVKFDNVTASGNDINLILTKKISKVSFNDCNLSGISLEKATKMNRAITICYDSTDANTSPEYSITASTISNFLVPSSSVSTANSAIVLKTGEESGFASLVVKETTISNIANESDDGYALTVLNSKNSSMNCLVSLEDISIENCDCGIKVKNVGTGSMQNGISCGFVLINSVTDKAYDGKGVSNAKQRDTFKNIASTSIYLEGFVTGKGKVGVYINNVDFDNVGEIYSAPNQATGTDEYSFEMEDVYFRNRSVSLNGYQWLNVQNYNNVTVVHCTYENNKCEDVNKPIIYMDNIKNKTSIDNCVVQNVSNSLTNKENYLLHFKSCKLEITNCDFSNFNENTTSSAYLFDINTMSSSEITISSCSIDSYRAENGVLRMNSTATEVCEKVEISDVSFSNCNLTQGVMYLVVNFIKQVDISDITIGSKDDSVSDGNSVEGLGSTEFGDSTYGPDEGLISFYEDGANSQDDVNPILNISSINVCKNTMNQMRVFYFHCVSGESLTLKTITIESNDILGSLSSGYSIIGFDNTKIKNISLEDITIDNNKVGVDWGMYIANGNNFSISGYTYSNNTYAESEGFGGGALRAVSCTSVTVDNTNISGNNVIAELLSFKACNSVSIKNGTIDSNTVVWDKNNSALVMQFDTCSKIISTNNAITNNSANIFAASGKTSTVAINGGSIESNVLPMRNYENDDEKYEILKFDNIGAKSIELTDLKIKDNKFNFYDKSNSIASCMNIITTDGSFVESLKMDGVELSGTLGVEGNGIANQLFAFGYVKDIRVSNTTISNNFHNATVNYIFNFEQEFAYSFTFTDGDISGHNISGIMNATNFAHTMTFKDSTVSGNQIREYAFYNNGKLWGINLDNVVFASNKIIGSNADNTLVYITNEKMSISNCTFRSNTSSSSSYASCVLFDGDSKYSYTLKSCVFYANEGSGNYGGAVYVNTAEASIILDSCIFNFNQATNGVINVAKTSNFVANNCIFRSNTSTLNGGVIYGKVVSLNGCTFEKNSANEKGGAVYITANGSLLIDKNSEEQTTFSENFVADSTSTSRAGGAVYIDLNSTVVFYGGVFESNYINGAMYGGAVYVGSGSTLTLSKNASSGKVVQFTNNGKEENFGGAIANFGTMYMYDAIATGNKGRTGAFVYQDTTGTLVAENCTISSNVSSAYGGGIALNGGKASIKNCSFVDNRASTYGGGIYWTSASSNANENLNILDCSFEGSSQTTGAGVAIAITGNNQYANAIINNVKIANTAGTSAIYVSNGIVLIEDLETSKEIAIGLEVKGGTVKLGRKIVLPGNDDKTSYGLSTSVEIQLSSTLIEGSEIAIKPTKDGVIFKSDGTYIVKSSDFNKLLCFDDSYVLTFLINNTNDFTKNVISAVKKTSSSTIVRRDFYGYSSDIGDPNCTVVVLCDANTPLYGLQQNSCTSEATIIENLNEDAINTIYYKVGTTEGCGYAFYESMKGIYVSVLPTIGTIQIETPLDDSKIIGGEVAQSDIGESVIAGTFAWAKDSNGNPITPKTIGLQSFSIVFTPSTENKKEYPSITFNVLVDVVGCEELYYRYVASYHGFYKTESDAMNGTNEIVKTTDQLAFNKAMEKMSDGGTIYMCSNCPTAINIYLDGKTIYIKKMVADTEASSSKAMFLFKNCVSSVAFGKANMTGRIIIDGNGKSSYHPLIEFDARGGVDYSSTTYSFYEGIEIANFNGVGCSAIGVTGDARLNIYGLKITNCSNTNRENEDYDNAGTYTATVPSGTDNIIYYGGGALSTRAGEDSSGNSHSPIITIENIDISECSSGFYGGAICFNSARNSTSEYNITITNMTIKDCNAQYGGAIATLVDSGIIIKNMTLSYNYATQYGGAIYFEYVESIYTGEISYNSAGVYGGGIYFNKKNENTVEVGFNEQNPIDIVGNTAQYSGAGVYASCDIELSFANIVSNSITLEDTTEGIATNLIAGAGLYVEGKLTLKNSTIKSNKIFVETSAITKAYGGGAYVYDVDFNDVTITQNSIVKRTGKNESTYLQGAGLYVRKNINILSNSTIENSSITNNFINSDVIGVFAGGAGISAITEKTDGVSFENGITNNLIIKDTEISNNFFGKDILNLQNDTKNTVYTKYDQILLQAYYNSSLANNNIQQQLVITLDGITSHSKSSNAGIGSVALSPSRIEPTINTSFFALKGLLNITSGIGIGATNNSLASPAMGSENYFVSTSLYIQEIDDGSVVKVVLEGELKDLTPNVAQFDSFGDDSLVNSLANVAEDGTTTQLDDDEKIERLSSYPKFFEFVDTAESTYESTVVRGNDTSSMFYIQLSTSASTLSDMVYWNPSSGDDLNNDGSDVAKAVKTLERAIELTRNGGTIILTSNYQIGIDASTIGSSVTLSAKNRIIKRYSKDINIQVGNATLTLQDIVFDENDTTSSAFGTLIVVEKAGTLKIESGTSLTGIYGDFAINNVGTVVINGGQFVLNKSGLITSSGSVTINDGLFYENLRQAGGSVLTATAGSVVVNGGSFIKNSAFSEGENLASAIKIGGVFYIEKGAELTINDGSFEENNAIFGAVIYSRGSVEIVGGVFHNNSAVSANIDGEYNSYIPSFGGVAFIELGTFVVSGGTFTLNKATNGAVFAVGNNSNDSTRSVASLKISSNALITGNENTVLTTNSTDNNGAPVNNIYTSSTDTALINDEKMGAKTLAMYLSSGEDFGVGGAIYGYKNATIEILGGKIYSNLAIKYGGAIYAYGSILTISGGAISDNGFKTGMTVENNTYTNVTNCGGAIYYKSATGGLFNPVTVYAGKTTISGIDNSNVRFIVNGGTISGNKATQGGAIYLAGDSGNASTLVVSGGTISGNGSYDKQNILGGAIFGMDNTYIEIRDGAYICENKASNGGAIYTTGNLFVAGGEILNNESALSGGVNASAIYFNKSDSSIVINGGVITGNKVTSGSVGYAVIVNAGKLYIGENTYVYGNEFNGKNSDVLFTTIKGDERSVVVYDKFSSSAKIGVNFSFGDGSDSVISEKLLIAKVESSACESSILESFSSNGTYELYFDLVGTGLYVGPLQLESKITYNASDYIQKYDGESHSIYMDFASDTYGIEYYVVNEDRKTEGNSIASLYASIQDEQWVTDNPKYSSGTYYIFFRFRAKSGAKGLYLNDDKTDFYDYRVIKITAKEVTIEGNITVVETLIAGNTYTSLTFTGAKAIVSSGSITKVVKGEFKMTAASVKFMLILSLRTRVMQ
jgi:predicted outer membrane repeat protein